MSTELDAQTAALPQEVGRLTTGWKAAMGVGVLLLAFGVVAFIRELSTGMVATGMRNVGTMGGASWGLYITMVVYFIGVSFAGITIAALIRLFDLQTLRPIARLAETLTVVSLLLGAIAIIVDLGQPLRGIVNLFRYARPQSPFFGTFSLVIAGYLFASLIYLYLGGRSDAAELAQTPSRLQWFHRLWAAGYTDTPEQRARHRQTSFWLAIAIIPLLVIAHSTLGFVFGLQVGRPGWYGTLQAPAFVVLAGVSGVGHIIVLSAIVRKMVGDKSRIGIDVFAMLGKFLLAMVVIYLYFMAVELLTLLYATPEVEEQLSDALLTGRYAWLYWGAVAMLVVPAIGLSWQVLTRRWNIGWLIAFGIAVNFAAIAKRFLIVVPSQTHGTLLPYEVGSYSPSWVEYCVVLGLFGLGALMIGTFFKVFPALPLHRKEPAEAPPNDNEKENEEVLAHA
jgi:molybdopterin-containing oxidoreductase family membrane subunit